MRPHMSKGILQLDPTSDRRSWGILGGRRSAKAPVDRARAVENANRAFRASSQRLARSAGGSPARATARSPVAWIAGRREIEDLKPIDNPIGRMGASHRAAAEANVDVASKERSPEGPTCETGVKAVWDGTRWLTCRPTSAG